MSNSHHPPPSLLALPSLPRLDRPLSVFCPPCTPTPPYLSLPPLFPPLLYSTPGYYLVFNCTLLRPVRLLSAGLCSIFVKFLFSPVCSFLFYLIFPPFLCFFPLFDICLFSSAYAALLIQPHRRKFLDFNYNRLKNKPNKIPCCMRYVKLTLHIHHSFHLCQVFSALQPNVGVAA